MRNRDHIIAASVVAAVVVLWVVGSGNSTFRVFFSWPNGGTWSNTVAAVEDGLAFSFVLWYYRDHVGPRLAAWWNKHHAPHAEAQHEGTRAHTTNELLSLEQRLTGRLDEIEALIRDAGGN